MQQFSNGKAIAANINMTLGVTWIDDYEYWNLIVFAWTCLVVEILYIKSETITTVVVVSD